VKLNRAVAILQNHRAFYAPHVRRAFPRKLKKAGHASVTTLQSRSEAIAKTTRKLGSRELAPPGQILVIAIASGHIVRRPTGFADGI
jgi:hypothetical protein